MRLNQQKEEAIKSFKGIEELRGNVGKVLGTSDWHQVTQTDVNQFADATRDHQWIHTDLARAAEGPFGGTIVHGYLTLALVPYLVNQVFNVRDVSMVVNYGLNAVRFPVPLPVDATVRAIVELKSVDTSPAGHKVVTGVTIEAAAAGKPVCVAEIIMLIIE